MLHKAIQHFPLLSLELSTSTPDSVVFYKTCKHEFPVQNFTWADRSGQAYAALTSLRTFERIKIASFEASGRNRAMGCEMLSHQHHASNQGTPGLLSLGKATAPTYTSLFHTALNIKRQEYLIQKSCTDFNDTTFLSGK